MGKILFFSHPRCSTVRKAEKWLIEHAIDFEKRDIIEDNPTAEELKAWHAKSGLPLRRFFNTSGMLYRELGIKKKLDDGLSDGETYDLLATDGMLVKRPLVIGSDFVLIGFREEEWAKALLS